MLQDRRHHCPHLTDRNTEAQRSNVFYKWWSQDFFFFKKVVFSPMPFSFFFFMAAPTHMEVPRLGVKWELQLPAFATATPDPSRLCDPYSSPWQCQILNPLNEARDRS